MRSFVLVIVLLAVSITGLAQADSVKTRVILVGDAGALDKRPGICS